MSILIVGDDKYPEEGLVTHMTGNDYHFDVAAFIPKDISADIDAFRRIICLIYGTDKAKNQIESWTTNESSGVDVAVDILEEKHVMLVNKTNNCWKIKKFLKDNPNYKTVILLGNKAYKLKETLDKLSIDITILSYPHPSERSGDSIYWRDIDYIHKVSKYNKIEDLEKVFRIGRK
ncbi:hypothetical protein [Lactococcus garvieae]|uniref:Uracil DNA glycosylase superfamily protein n=1 Tax=Lactococcus garvieae (strain Lg2) TaxID=420890 RepID=F9VE40_LACGL|nr:hypothetical protein [Lactococcus garvieae]YP_009279639.1 hypothetical protein BI048_gp25 [Lactococcus phage PLgT-1]ANA49638.1 hypothetical protein PlgT1_25 [Lactococcus phage PLgT-1]EOT33307.1 hypothetical protein OO3_00498 [Lactococcus garvieae ATCC 49156]EOT93346.1 hypothetical protein I578_00883 [Lactococcus garvieae ATCC 49156]BAK58624.1 hypothetical protein LCGT_1111 [Lactococcus garvieae ATCC 49156]BAK60591.1 hypothetical protein LCGL_1131 [Lactococcus garvieae Lg2]